MAPMNEFIMENTNNLMEYIDFVSVPKEPARQNNAAANSSLTEIRGTMGRLYGAVDAPRLYIDTEKELAYMALYLTWKRDDVLKAAAQPTRVSIHGALERTCRNGRRLEPTRKCRSLQDDKQH